MDDSIINIDDESDSFSLSSDTDVRNIVDQWKRNHATTDQKDSKYFDTRTFTRPKKRLFTYADVNSTLSKTSSDDMSEEATTSTGMVVPRIDLKIGGLVTSLQRSMLGDMSPPSHMDNSMGNSLITSNDFSNIDFINDTGDSLSMANFKEYRLSDAINDRNFLERLTNYDESLFTKDADINNVDLNENGNCSGSSNSTLQNSTDSTGQSSKQDGTFVAAKELANGTFNATLEVDKTFIQAPSANTSVRNHTFELGTNVNQTFEAQPTVKPTANLPPQLLLEDEELSLCESFNVTKNLDYKKSDGVANVSVNHLLRDGGSAQLDLNSTFQLDEYQSTPAAQKLRKSRKSETLAAISPIFSENTKQHPANNLTQIVDKFVDIEIEDIPVFLRDSAPKSATRASNPTGIDTELREKERRSLAKFEEFENTLLILENNKSEEEFDDLLNSFSANVRSPMSDKVRQSLDHIKKRHSLIGVEKQQQDELNPEKALNTSKNGKYSEYGAHEKNRLNDSFGRTALNSSMTSSIGGNSERLLRRSRLFDDVINASTDRISDNGDGGYIDNKQAVELNSTLTLNRKNQMHLEKEPTPKTEHENMYNADDAGTDSKANNRDRFKTIRIFKKPPENAVQIPDPDEMYAREMHSPLPTARTAELFATKNTNSPKQHEYNEDQGAKKAINSMTYKRSGLARPRQLSGLVKRDHYGKSNSQELLSSNEHLSQIHSKPVPQLKSPMGIKSKSVHNLSTVKSNSKPTGAHSELTGVEHPTAGRTQPLSSHTFKMPAPKSVVTMRQRADGGQPRKLSLIRPSSGYYGYKRTDSDTDLGRFSSNNSLSSGSSKSSLSRGETPESYSTTNENANATFVQPPVKTANVPSRSATANGASGILQPKLSLLRPPNQIRRSALPRPAATVTKR